MNENIAKIQEFLNRGEMRLCRDLTMFQIMSIDESGLANTIMNPISENRRVTIILTEKEIAELASLCFPQKKVGG